MHGIASLMRTSSMYSGAQCPMTSNAIYGVVSETRRLCSVLKAFFDSLRVFEREFESHACLTNSDRCHDIANELLYHSSLLSSDMFV